MTAVVHYEISGVPIIMSDLLITGPIDKCMEEHMISLPFNRGKYSEFETNYRTFPMYLTRKTAVSYDQKCAIGYFGELKDCKHIVEDILFHYEVSNWQSQRDLDNYLIANPITSLNGYVISVILPGGTVATGHCNFTEAHMENLGNVYYGGSGGKQVARKIDDLTLGKGYTVVNTRNISEPAVLRSVYAVISMQLADLQSKETLKEAYGGS